MMELVSDKKWFRNGWKIGGIAAGGVGFLMCCGLLVEIWPVDVVELLVFLSGVVVFGLTGAVGAVAGKAITKWRTDYQKAVEIAAGTVGGIVIGFVLFGMIFMLLMAVGVIEIGCPPRHG